MFLRADNNIWYRAAGVRVPMSTPFSPDDSLGGGGGGQERGGFDSRQSVATTPGYEGGEKPPLPATLPPQPSVRKRGSLSPGTVRTCPFFSSSSFDVE